MNKETVDWINSHFNEYNVLDIDLPIEMKVILIPFKLKSIENITKDAHIQI
jgi:hypothetical protein